LVKDTHGKPEIKVTDKRIFTSEGEIREEFRNEIQPADPAVATAAPEAPQPAKPHAEERRREAAAPPSDTGERRKTIADKASSPGTPFANFIEPLIAQAYMSLGMLRNPYQPQTKIDVGSARQMIDILTLLQDKTRGNLTPEEEDFLDTHLGELKLAYVQRTKSL
jgi:hypothetical protein